MEIKCDFLVESQLASGAGKGVSSDFGGTGADGFGK